ncbi:MAG: adenylyltransferase/cytidyltransferase family protein [Candidatus Altiarchaeales archaeon]|nr:adenylyltransferase/cytidyltransferase family protein [Candidatus Altiarchaeales archaeon]
MSTFGNHSPEEWESVKKRFNYCCAECGIEESALIFQSNSQFSALTRDHIIPISKGGTDLINNIQPLCISCNAKKRDHLDLDFSPEFLAPIVTLHSESFQEIRPRLGKVVCTSCPADPLHPGHLSCLLESKRYGNSLVVIVNGDWFLTNKKGRPFMPLEVRSQIVAGIRGVDLVVPFEIEDDTTVCEALKVIQPHVFTKGGDRTDPTNIPEWEVCEDLGIEIITGVGDSKVHSSSNLLEDWYHRRINLFMEQG